MQLIFLNGVNGLMRWINPKTGIAVGAVSLLSIVAAMGWNRTPSASAIVDSPQPVLQPASFTAPMQSNYVQGGSYSNGYYDQSAPVYRQRVRSHRRHRRSRYVSSSRRYYGNTYTTTRYVRPRSGKKSVAIVAGTAGVGAAIGALAGGGRGAAIGALSGGGAGFLYDRLTHRRPPQF